MRLNCERAWRLLTTHTSSKELNARGSMATMGCQRFYIENMARYLFIMDQILIEVGLKQRLGQNLWQEIEAQASIQTNTVKQYVFSVEVQYGMGNLTYKILNLTTSLNLRISLQVC